MLTRSTDFLITWYSLEGTYGDEVKELIRTWFDQWGLVYNEKEGDPQELITRGFIFLGGTSAVQIEATREDLFIIIREISDLLKREGHSGVVLFSDNPKITFVNGEDRT